MKAPELLLPAGSMETLQIALRYGADAVYFGGKNLSLRAKAHNFTSDELLQAIRLSHAAGVRAYITANAFAREEELEIATAFFSRLAGLPKNDQPDGLLVADPGLLLKAREQCPEIPLHLSTQANTTNSSSCLFWYRAGVRRIVLARELSLREIRSLRGKLPSDCTLECFVHGAMCISYSGRCLLSRAMTGRDANRGACAHPCRYEYALVERKRPGKFFTILEDEKGSEILASDDLCMLAHLPELIEAGVESFKVEGRMKNALYVASVGRAYRRAIDLLLAEGTKAYLTALPSLLAEVHEVATRKLSTGFYYEESETDPPQPADEAAIGCDNGSLRDESHTGRVFLGVVEEVGADGRFLLTQRNRFSVGDQILVMKPPANARGSCAKISMGSPGSPVFRDPTLRVVSITTGDGEERKSAPHPKEKLYILALPFTESASGDAVAPGETENDCVTVGDVIYAVPVR